MDPGPEFSSIESLLRSRGYEIVGTGDPTKALIPVIDGTSFSGIEAKGPNLQWMARPSFRKVVRAFILAQGESVPISRLESMAGADAQDYLDVLATRRMAECQPDSARVTRCIDNFGPTLCRCLGVSWRAGNRATRRSLLSCP